MGDYPPTIHRTRMRWRQGAGRGRTGNVYAQAGDKPDPDDDLICIADTAELAIHIVAAHNSLLYPQGPKNKRPKNSG